MRIGPFKSFKTFNRCTPFKTFKPGPSSKDALHGEPAARNNRWSEAIAVGSLAFVEKVKGELGVKALHREVIQADGVYALREPAEAYAGKFTDKNEALRSRKTLPSGMKAKE